MCSAKASPDEAPNHAREGFASNRTVFGRILRGDLDASVAYEDADVLCFRDIAPASEHHWLVIPKRHIAHAGALQPSDLPLLRRMVDVAGLVAQANGVADVAAARSSGALSFGFHVWPLISVSHLHLHVIHPMPARSCIKRIQHPMRHTWWFTTPESTAARFCGSKL